MTRSQLTSPAKIGIINRGEAAVRFIRALKEYNLKHQTSYEAVAFHLDSEAEALFVKEADITYRLSDLLDLAEPNGKMPYLNGALMVAALKHAGCQAAWVGWGFLAEDPGFASQLEQSDILLLGPSSTAMALLGDKIQAKELADKTQVPTVPWSKGALRDAQHAQEMAEVIGYPVILKSAYGGGGRGIRKVFAPEEMVSAFETTSDEIERFFGDRTLFMEALVVRGRHLEVQCIADYSGLVRTFSVRDCSVQRNNQKIIEETPPPGLSAQTLEDLEQHSRNLLEAAHYEGAATVEYLYDLDRDQAFFMEVNTRLQVEHPITEELFLIDLVAAQIQVAEGKSLADMNAEPRGHVMEMRLNAEDPDNNFIPTPGKIIKYQPPHMPGLRIDSGVEYGSTITPEFDSMIAKIIAHGSDRNHAIAKLTQALRDLKIEIKAGTTNQGFVLEILNDPAFQAGGVETTYVSHFLNQSRQANRKNWPIAVLAAAIFQYQQKFETGFKNISNKLTQHSIPRNIAEQTAELNMQIMGHKYNFLVRHLGERFFHVEVCGQTVVVEYFAWGRETVLTVAGHKYKVQIVPRAKALQCEVEGLAYLIALDDGGRIAAPSPSVVLTVDAQPGMQVKQGDLLLTLEAMKMEIAVTAQEDGRVLEVLAKPGEKVEAGQTLVELEPSSDSEDEAPAETGPRLDFTGFALHSESSHKGEIWGFLKRRYMAIFLGFDYTKPEQQTVMELRDFVLANPEFKPALMELLLQSFSIFTNIQLLIEPREHSSNAQQVNPFDLLFHYFMRSQDRDVGLPEQFTQRLKQAIDIYSGIDPQDDRQLRRAIFYILKAFHNTKAAVRQLKQALFVLQEIFPQESSPEQRHELAELLGELATCTPKYPELADAAIHSRYVLVDSFEIKGAQAQSQAVINQLLHAAMHEVFESKVGDIIESGHQIVTYLMSLEDISEIQHQRRLELIGRRFNRDREFISRLEVSCEVPVFAMQVKDQQRIITHLTAIVSEAEARQSLAWLEKLAQDFSSHDLEVIILVHKQAGGLSDSPIEVFEATPLAASMLSIGLFDHNKVVYYSFGHERGQWGMLRRRHRISPLRYRELKMDRLEKFHVELLAHTRYTHVLKLEACDNPKDKRLFAFVEIPEADFEVVDNKVQTIKNFQHAIYEAVQAIRRQQAQTNLRLFWNRIIIHIGQTHPVKLEYIDRYPDGLLPLVEGIGLEKVVIYTKVVGKKRSAIDAEVLIENFDTKYTVRGRRPSRKKLQPLSDYDTKLVRSVRSRNPYPYQVIKMLTSGASGFGKGRFIEYELSSSSSLEAAAISGRPFGQNPSNMVFGIISNNLQGCDYRRVIILGDPSRDLGSLAEPECRRAIAALNLAKQEQLPIEWIPVSSGAAIGMDTGTENLDWTAAVIKNLVEFTQAGGEVNIIVSGINVGAQSYWNAESTMLMHTSGLLIMTRSGSMVLTGKKALDFSGSVSAADNIDIGGAEKIMAPNGQAQIYVDDFDTAYQYLFQHYRVSYRSPELAYGRQQPSLDPIDRDICTEPYRDQLNPDFKSVGDILLTHKNKERKKPFDTRQIMAALRDQDAGVMERWTAMRDGETAIVWQTKVGGIGVGMLGIESQPITRLGDIPNDGPNSWNGGTLYPLSSKKVARALNAFSGKMPVVILANISGFDGSPESLRKLQLEYGAEIGRAVVNFKGPIVFVVLSRYHGGAYVVFSKQLNPHMKVLALEGTFASVIGGAPAAAVVFPRQVQKTVDEDPRVIDAHKRLAEGGLNHKEHKQLLRDIHLEKQAEMAQKFEAIHSIKRALSVGSLDEIIKGQELRPKVVEALVDGVSRYLKS